MLFWKWHALRNQIKCFALVATVQHQAYEHFGMGIPTYQVLKWGLYMSPNCAIFCAKVLIKKKNKKLIKTNNKTKMT